MKKRSTRSSNANKESGSSTDEYEVQHAQEAIDKLSKRFMKSNAVTDKKEMQSNRRGRTRKKEAKVKPYDEYDGDIENNKDSSTETSDASMKSPDHYNFDESEESMKLVLSPVRPTSQNQQKQKGKLKKDVPKSNKTGKVVGNPMKELKHKETKQADKKVTQKVVSRKRTKPNEESVPSDVGEAKKSRHSSILNLSNISRKSTESGDSEMSAGKSLQSSLNDSEVFISLRSTTRSKSRSKVTHTSTPMIVDPQQTLPPTAVDRPTSTPLTMSSSKRRSLGDTPHDSGIGSLSNSLMSPSSPMVSPVSLMSESFIGKVNRTYSSTDLGSPKLKPSPRYTKQAVSLVNTKGENIAKTKAKPTITERIDDLSKKKKVPTATLR